MALVHASAMRFRPWWVFFVRSFVVQASESPMSAADTAARAVDASAKKQRVITPGSTSPFPHRRKAAGVPRGVSRDVIRVGGGA